MIEIICTKHERTRKGFIIFCDIDFLFGFSFDYTFNIFFFKFIPCRKNRNELGTEQKSRWKADKKNETIVALVRPDKAR